MQSVDEFTPSTTEPVFGSGLISQTKSQTSSITTNDNNENEKTNSTSESVVNGQEEATKVNSNENITNGTTKTVSENNNVTDESVVHVNGENEKQIDESTKEKESVSTSETETVVAQVEPEPIVASAEPEPKSSTTKESSSSVNNEPPPPSASVDATETAVAEDVPQAPVATESKVVEPKSKSSRGKAKTPAASATPTRQSTRARKPVANIEENETSDVVSTTNQNEPSKRTKRQAATIAKDAITASNQPNSTSGSSIADDGNDQDEIPSDAGDDDDEINEGKPKRSSPSTRKKRGASTSTTNATKKAKGKNSINADNDATANQGEKIETPTKKARSSANKKAAEPPSEEYVRKLRPRK